MKKRQYQFSNSADVVMEAEYCSLLISISAKICYQDEKRRASLGLFITLDPEPILSLIPLPNLQGAHRNAQKLFEYHSPR